MCRVGIFNDILESNKEKIIQQYQSGIGTSTICKEYGCNCSTIRNYLIYWGVNVRGRLGKFECKGKHDEIIRLYEDGKSCYEISKTVEISLGSIHKYLSKLGYDTSRYSTQRKIPLKNYTEEIIERYLAGETAEDIGNSYDSCGVNVAKLLKKNKIEVRSRRQYEVNEDFFEKIDTPDKAYILGFAYADGNVRMGKHNIFRIGICDLDILEDMRAAMGYAGPIYKRERDERRKTIYTIQISSKKMCEDLSKWGCVPNKTFKINSLPQIDYMGHFIRGYFDGDGSVSKSGIPSLVGNEGFLHEIGELIGISYKIYDRHPERNNSTRNMQILRKDDAKKFFDFIYGELGLHLKRKYDRYINCYFS